MSNLIAKGRYRALSRDVQLGYTQKDDPQIAITFEILEECEFTGRQIVWFGYFTDKTKARTLESLRICGWVGDDLSNIGDLLDEVSIVVEHETDLEGEMQAKVRWVNRPGGGAFKMAKPMDPSQLKEFAQQMRGEARASAEGTPRPAARSPQPASGSRGGGGSGQYTERNPPPIGSGGSDDLPF